MGEYTLSLTLEELRIVSRALSYEVDRLDAIGNNRISDAAEDLEGRVHDMYRAAKMAFDNERSWIIAEMGRV
jgi:hypothetical protein